MMKAGRRRRFVQENIVEILWYCICILWYKFKTSFSYFNAILCCFFQHPLPYAPELHFQEFSSTVADMKNSVKNRDNAQSSCAGLFIGMAYIFFSVLLSWIITGSPVCVQFLYSIYITGLNHAFYFRFTSRVWFSRCLGSFRYCSYGCHCELPHILLVIKNVQCFLVTGGLNLHILLCRVNVVLVME